MADKRALVVDDSRAARVILQKMLQRHGLTVDTAASAEEALDYLINGRPDVIFMDHMMPGMDGFEAVRIIKRDPKTATIPIMMYTSKEGDLYLGQARALGAVGVLPKQVRQADLLEALEGLHLLGDEAPEPPATSGGDSAPEPAEVPAGMLSTQLIEDIARSAVEDSVQRIVDERLAEQRSRLRRDLQTSHEALVERLLAQLRGADAAGGEDADLGPHDYLAGRRRRWLPALGVAAVVALAVALVLTREPAPSGLPAGQQAAAGLIQGIERAAAPADAGQAAQERVRAHAAQAERDKLLLDSLNWALNQNAVYGYNDIALGGERVQLLSELVTRLAAAGYQGPVRVTVHSGEFCLVRNAKDELVPAPPGVAVEDCQQLGWPDAAQRGSRQTLAFANFLATAPALRSGKIRLQVASAGSSRPLVAYPAERAGQDSGVWNRIAERNHRLEISLGEP